MPKYVFTYPRQHGQVNAGPTLRRLTGGVHTQGMGPAWPARGGTGAVFFLPCLYSSRGTEQGQGKEAAKGPAGPAVSGRAETTGGTRDARGFHLEGAWPPGRRGCRCQNRWISGRGSRSVHPRLMVMGGRGHDVYPGSGPLYGGNTLLPA